MCFQAGQISHEEAFLAKQQCIQDKQDLVQKLRCTSQELMGQYFAQKQHEKVEMRRLVEATSAGQHNVREARAKLTEMKQKIGTVEVDKKMYHPIPRVLPRSNSDIIYPHAYHTPFFHTPLLKRAYIGHMHTQLTVLLATKSGNVEPALVFYWPRLDVLHQPTYNIK